MVWYTLFIIRLKNKKGAAIMKKNDDFEKFCEYFCRVEKNKYEVLKNEVDWETLYEEEDSYEDVVFNF